MTYTIVNARTKKIKSGITFELERLNNCLSSYLLIAPVHCFCSLCCMYQLTVHLRNSFFQIPVAFHCKGTPLPHANRRPHSATTNKMVIAFTSIRNSNLFSADNQLCIGSSLFPPKTTPNAHDDKRYLVQQTKCLTKRGRK